MTVQTVTSGFNYPADIMEMTYEFAGFDSALALSQTSRTMHALFQQLIERLIPMHFRRCPLDPLLLPREQYQQLAMAETSHARLVCTWQLQTRGALASVQMNAEGTKVIWGYQNGDIKIWDPKTKACIATLHENEGAVSHVQVNREGTRAISGSHDGTVKVWDLATRECIATLRGHTDCITRLQFNEEGTRVISGSHDGKIKIWDPMTEECLTTLDHGGALEWVQVDRAGTRLVSTSSNLQTSIYDIKIWDLASGGCIRTIDYGDTPLTCVQMSADGTKIIAGDLTGTIKIWDPVTGECLGTLEGHQGSVLCLHTNADGTKLVSGGLDKSLKIWDLGLNRCVRQLRDPSGIPDSVHMSEEERTAIAIFLGSDSFLKVLDLKPSPEELVHNVVKAFSRKEPNAPQLLQRLPRFVQEQITFQEEDEAKSSEDHPNSEYDRLVTVKRLNCYIAKVFLPNIVELYNTDRQAAKKRFGRLPREIQQAITRRYHELRALLGGAVCVLDIQQQAMKEVAQNPNEYL